MNSLVNQLSSSYAMSEEEEAFGYAWYLRSSHMFSYVLDAAVQLGVFDILTKAGPDVKLSSNQIASEIRAKNPDAPSLLDRMLRLLACHGLVTCVSRKLDAGAGNGEDGERVYGVTLAGKAFVNDEHNGSLAAFTSNKVDIEVWLRFKDLVLEGGNLFEKVHGMPAYQYKSLNPENAKRHDTAMTNLSKIIMKKILERYNGFQGVTTLVDVGGGYGVTLNMVISKYPSIKGINYELPHVVQQAPSFPDIEHVGGDMFSTVPKADTIMMKEVLHNWDDEHCLKLLKNCYEALEEKGKVIVISYMMFEEAEGSNAAKFLYQMDLYMATKFVAKQRTEKQFKSMAMDAGFSSFQLKCLVFNVVAVMELHK
ncbi:hypothetical protein ERO13_D10G199000v2 [Gossypium hirsutum]|uniref:Caffeic acid 3-O-methyltransferase n=2 Tax=Gossypium TaxID=3633 RepID=A0ABM3AX25_GOSHI|nr:caffeic acid 3-O-methyltransferase [Gossypium raimondii]XP_040959333.1 caffeic acid 3-O-methyltransferase [Gossypium hirsutum]KAG4127110.1 hypothetical protein ERO13_D10G199000v2 [Gossypium hirsutum]